METYDPTDDIMNFRDYPLPWDRVESTDRVFHGSGSSKHALEGEIVRPIAYNATERLVLLYTGGYPLVVCRSDSPNGGYGEIVCWYENISHFDSDAQSSAATYSSATQSRPTSEQSD